MWNLTADDVQRAKEELKGRRAAIQARYENELKQLEVDIADLETFERFAVKFVSDFKGEEAAAEAVEPAPAVEATPLAANVVAEPDNQANSAVAGDAGEKLEAAASGETGVRKGTSRWRMHLSTGEASA